MGVAELILPAEIASDWEDLRAVLVDAIEVDPSRQEADVFRDLMAGDMALIRVDAGDMQGFVVIEFDAPRCLLLYAAGSIGNLWHGTFRPILAGLEELARRNGCTEMRIEGRDWSRLLTDYEPGTERPWRNELVKRL